MSEQTPTAVEPCPFCGATPHRGLGKIATCQLHGDPLQDFSFWCPHGCAKITKATYPLALAAWNTRPSATPTPAPDAVAEGLREFLTSDGGDRTRAWCEWGHNAVPAVADETSLAKLIATTAIQFNGFHPMTSSEAMEASDYTLPERDDTRFFCHDEVDAKAIARVILAALPASQPVADVEEPGPFAEWADKTLSAQCRMQARENLDPEYCQFMFAVADRLATLTARVETLLDQRVQLRDRVAAVSGYGTDSDILDDDKLVDVVSDLARDYRAATARVETLEGALRPFAKLAQYMVGRSGHVLGWNHDNVSYDDFRNADAALSPDPAVKPSEGEPS